jgi:hypothetical protein
MPVIDYRSEPPALTPEGPCKFYIVKTGFGTSRTNNIDYFGYTFRDLRTNIEFTDTIYLTKRSAWKMEAFCRSVGLTLPDGPYKITTDDFDHRVGYGALKHRELPKSGRKVAEFAGFWSCEYAIEQEPSLATIPDPADAVTDEVTLPLDRRAKAAAATVAATPPPDDSELGIDF